MTLLSRRKRRTTVRSITPGTAAAKAALVLALFAAPVLAQPPGTPTRSQPGGPTPPGQTGGPSNGLALPPGYRPRTPPPQAPAQPVRPASGSAGTVMYFQKPADALTASGGGLPDDGVAQLGEPVRTVPLPVPDAAPVRPLPVPEARPAAPIAVPSGFVTQPEVQPPAPKPQPGDTATPKEEYKTKDVDPRDVQLPSRDKVLGVAYNDPELEQAIMQNIRDELKRQVPSIPVAALEKYLVFPPLPPVSPAGVPYQPKTMAYAPRKLLVEPGYVVHRRLGFEEQNAERQGWDLGPVSTLVSAGYFYRNVLLWPQSLVSGCVFGFWDTSAGKCLPGSPSPYYLYPPNLTVSGGLAEAGLITGFSFLFP